MIDRYHAISWVNVVAGGWLLTVPRLMSARMRIRALRALISSSASRRPRAGCRRAFAVLMTMHMVEAELEIVEAGLHSKKRNSVVTSW